MKIIYTKKQLVNFVLKQKNLGFVPTMGAIHMGHASLIKKSIKQSDKTIVTIFINKPQFNRKNDFLKYPGLYFPHNFFLKTLILILLFGPFG